MRLSIKARQVAGVTSIVALAVIGLSLIHLASLARVRLEESQSRGQMLAHAIYQRTREVVAESADPYTAIPADPGIRSLLESSIAYSRDVTYAAILDPTGFAIAHSSPSQQGNPLPLQGDLDALVQRGSYGQLRAIFSDRTFEVREPLLLGNERFGSIRIGVSTLLIRHELQQALRPAGVTALLALVVATLVAMLLAQWILRPIHVIRSGLSRLGRGEFGVTLDLPPGDEFRDLGTSFNAISEQLSSARVHKGGEAASLESVAQGLEDAVAMVDPDGHVVFANTAMQVSLPDDGSGASFRSIFPADHPYRRLIDDSLRTRKSRGPISVTVPGMGDAAPAEWLILTHAIESAERQFLGVLLVARNLGYLSQVQSSIRYSRKLAALGRLFAGLAHEVKNPLNAMTIHLELVKQKLSKVLQARAAGDALQSEGAALRSIADAAAEAPVRLASGGSPRRTAVIALSDSVPPERADILKHVTIIGDEIRRLDQVMQDFLKFARPEELKPQPTELHSLLSDVRHVIEPEVLRNQIALRIDCPEALPSISGDPGMLKQVFLNLALNACQAMPSGGVLRITCGTASGRRVRVDVEDTGTGIRPDHLEKIFDLYFTTKEKGSGIGLSLVFRIVQLHDGEIEVQSMPGHGTTFRVLLPQAAESLTVDG